MQWGAGGRVWSFSPFLMYFALGNWKEAHTHLAKLIRSLGVETFTSFGHQAGVSTWWACHPTHSWGSSKGGLGIAEQAGSSPLLPDNSALDRNSCRCWSKAGGFPKSPPADWDQSTVSLELPDSKKESSPSMGYVRATISVVSSESLDGE